MAITIKGWNPKFEAVHDLEITNQSIASVLNDARNIFVRAMQRGPHNGKRRKGGRRSAAGEYPASETGRLAGATAVALGNLHGEIGSNVFYAAYLADGTSKANGTSKMDARKMYEEALEESLEKNGHKLNDGLGFRII